MTEWIDRLQSQHSQGEAAVLATVIEARGSTPREAGPKMIVGREHSHGTVGGGHLEFKVVEIARAMLTSEQDQPRTRIEKFALGPDLGQCCGGHATVLLETVPVRISDADWWPALNAAKSADEPSVLVTVVPPSGGPSRKILVGTTAAAGSLGSARIDAEATARARRMLQTALHGAIPEPRMERLSDGALLLHEPMHGHGFDVVLFGAGHVGKAVVAVMAGLPCRIAWIDSRKHEFPPEVPSNVTVNVSAAPEREIAGAPSGAFYLIMTHDHRLDLGLCENILRRGDSGYLGLIGSDTKRVLFAKRLLARDVSPSAISRLTCPIGVTGIDGKHPHEIAVAVAAEILQIRERALAGTLAPAEPAARTA